MSPAPSPNNEPGSRAAFVLATWFGCGLVPVAPGTAGSAAAILMGAAAAHWLAVAPPDFTLAALVLLFPAVWAADQVCRALKSEDPGLIVIDEVIGQWMTLAGAISLNWKSWLLAFLVFRILDILKPFPARRLESLPGGLGVIADDVMAGVYGALVMALAGWVNLY